MHLALSHAVSICCRPTKDIRPKLLCARSFLIYPPPPTHTPKPLNRNRNQLERTPSWDLYSHFISGSSTRHSHDCRKQGLPMVTPGDLCPLGLMLSPAATAPARVTGSGRVSNQTHMLPSVRDCSRLIKWRSRLIVSSVLTPMMSYLWPRRK